MWTTIVHLDIVDDCDDLWFRCSISDFEDRYPSIERRSCWLGVLKATFTSQGNPESQKESLNDLKTRSEGNPESHKRTPNHNSEGNPESQKESQRTPKTNSVEIRESQGNPERNPESHFSRESWIPRGIPSQGNPAPGESWQRNDHSPRKLNIYGIMSLKH